MRAVIQRVSQAEVIIENRLPQQIKRGILLLLGVGPEDDESSMQKLAEKIIKLRIFSDEAGKMNLSLAEIQGEILVVPQFTLYADCKKGNRPSFTQAAPPDQAKRIYDFFIDSLAIMVLKTCGVDKLKTGEFGADMKVNLTNDGPVTILLDSKSL